MPSPSLPGQCRQRIPVILQVALCIVGAACAFAQHVEAEGQRVLRAAQRLGACQCRLHVFAEHELPPEQLHRTQRGGDDGTCAQPAQQMFIAGQQLVRQGQCCG